MSITLSFNQLLALILVIMLAVLLAATIILYVRISKTADRIDKIADDVGNVSSTVNDSVSRISSKLMADFTNINQLAVMGAIVIMLVTVDRRIRRNIKKK